MSTPRTPSLQPLLRPATVLLMVPPFAWLDRPAIGVHLLQALGRAAGIEVQVLYANFLFAARFGERTYDTLARMQYGMLLGERLFSRAAFGGPPLGRDEGRNLRARFDALRQSYERSGRRYSVDLDRLLGLEAALPDWLESFLPQVRAAGYPVVGCTTSFEQTSASIAILRALKRSAPQIVTIMGGANCEGEMAEGLRALPGAPDHVFSGESERTFLAFAQLVARGERPDARIWHGEPWQAMDELPTPDYSDYYEQLRVFLPDSALHSGGCYLPYESSRGCWWGQKSHCTFCGLNGQGMAFREKSPDRVISELRQLTATHPTRRVTITDNIMPHSYFRTLLPRLPRELPGLELMYEEKANLTLRQVCDLRRAGVTEIQPGIEALSTGLLRLMAKGTSAAQNIALLRYARATGMVLQWNLLYGFPGDLLRHYTETLELLPLLYHLPPPKRVNPIILDRFSPYHSHPERFGISDLRPLPAYRDVFPEGTPVAKLAYHFEGTFASEALQHPEVIGEIAAQVQRWRARYYSDRPAELTVSPRPGGGYTLRDTRGIPGLPDAQTIDEAQAVAALVPRLRRSWEEGVRAWAAAHCLIVERDGRTVPLATADPELMLALEDRFRGAALGLVPQAEFPPPALATRSEGSGP